VSLSVPAGRSTAIAVLRGAVSANGSRRLDGPGLLVLDRDGDEVSIAAAADATLLLLSGEPLAEPIVGVGPFVMNSRQEIETAMRDFRRGKFGRMPPLQAAADARTADA
jgi:redox-sensitive bicupin YhaK (pirin superfamily)